MSIKRSIAACACAAMLSLTVVGCNGGASQATPSETALPIEQFTNVSGATIHLDEANKEAAVEVEVSKDESLVIMANFEHNDGEVTAVVSANGEEQFTDYLYSGYGYSATEVDPGTYTVRIAAPDGAKGTMWVLAHRTDTIDIMTMETEQIVNEILSDVS